MWYSIVRHSVDVKIMCRFPKAVFKAKAQELYQEYLVSCMHQRIQPETVTIDNRWVSEFLLENRLSHRRPNRKWKVSRETLKERLKLFWISICSVRMFVQLVKGYDPHMRNLDQSPFHMNETGSKATGTITIKGVHVVPLLENHAATRDRWSLNSMTDSNEARIRSGVLPGCEVMVKAAAGGLKAKRL